MKTSNILGITEMRHLQRLCEQDRTDTAELSRSIGVRLGYMIDNAVAHQPKSRKKGLR